MKTIDLIIQEHERLEKELVTALSTMERKDNIARIRLDMLKNQRRCPHFDSNYNWAIIEDTCPYCGMKLLKEEGE